MPQPVDPRFPQPVQEIWASLHADVVWLHGRWIVYRQLYGTNKARVDLLNEAAANVASIIHDVLLHDVQLSISKIGDPPGSGDRKNLTLRRLQLELRSAGETEIADAMTPRLETFDAACEKVRHRRNKWIAHSDLTTLLKARATPLLGPSRQEIETALAALRHVMNCVELKYTDGETAYEHFVMNQTGEQLIDALAKGKRYRELVKAGQVPRDDFRQRFQNQFYE
ncbi:hypothetical protein WK11_25645 [Burkholderia ubonensis]|uniref:AbiU2 domain-containing protein n=1 Tax=Burkholderia ubonensis TaxID=101571 RepID=UPI0007591142|nr:hypothetical protein [Burkholderia ubonensis]KVR16155.1 hypothetical protein WK11_25645 [Burkholderia ubonensis]